MRVPARYFTILLLVLVTAGASARAAGQAATALPKAGPSGAVRGTVTDQSAGVLPGVTVTASVGGRELETTVTSGTGEFGFGKLPAGDVDLLFHLDGFEDFRARVTIQPGGPAGEARLVQQLALPARTESVVVHANPPPAPPVPRPVLAPVPDHDQDSVCGPAKAEGVIQSQGIIRSRQDEVTQGLFASGDELLIDGGTGTGLRAGQNFVVRRRYPTALTTGRGLVVMGEHSSGVVQIVSVAEQVSTAVVVYACDEMMSGDYLAPFEPGPIRAPDPAGTPAFDLAGRILFADAGQLLGATRRMMVIDRGLRHGVQVGQRVTLFRRSRFGGGKPAVVGEAVVVSVRRESATVRVEQANDVIFFGDHGDWAAPQRPVQRAAN